MKVRVHQHVSSSCITTEDVLFSPFHCLHSFIYTNSCSANHRYDIGIPFGDRMKHYSYHGLWFDCTAVTSRYLDSESFFSGLRWLIWLWFIIIYSQYVVSWNVTKFISLTSPCIYFFCKTWCWLSESLWFPFRSSVEINSFNNGNKSTHSGYQPRRSWKHRHENRVVPTGSLPSLWRFHQGRIRSGFR